MLSRQVGGLALEAQTIGASIGIKAPHPLYKSVLGKHHRGIETLVMFFAVNLSEI